MSRKSRWTVILVLACAAAGCDLFAFLPPALNPTAQSWILKWNQIAVDTSGLDHTPVIKGESRVFGHQLGPTRASRAMAIVHIAMFEAVNAIVGGYESYTGTPPVAVPASMQSAIAQAAFDALVALYPSHAPRLNELLAESLNAIPDGPEKDAGIALGKSTAAAILAMRAGDGSEINDPYIFSDQPGKWRRDPLNPTQDPLGDEWGKVKPFVMTRSDQFRVPPPPDISSAEYAVAFDEAQKYGGDGIVTPTIRTEEQSQIGIYWAYDGTPSLCAPPRLYNQIAVRIAMDRGLNVVEMARLLALVNVALADAGIAVWESKYFYNYWRPVTGIREAEAGTGPTGLGDNNVMTVGDAAFTPLGAPASNLAGPNFTPPFPAYPSGHAGFGGAIFETLRNYFGTDAIAFTFVSDEFNGVTVDNAGNTRPILQRSFSSLTQAEEENGQSRIYLGIHWSFDKSEGIHQGNRVADFVFKHLYRPTP